MMEVVTSWRRLVVLFSAILLPACQEQTSPGAPSNEGAWAEGVRLAERAPLHPFGTSHDDGSETVMHPCRWEEVCTAPCNGPKGTCCEAKWACPPRLASIASSHRVVKPKDSVRSASHAPRRSPSPSGARAPRGVLH